MKFNAFDLETHLIDRGYKAPRPVCISWAKGTGAAGIALAEEIPTIVGAMLESDDQLINAKIAFDFSVVAEYWPEMLPAIFDKYDRSQVLDVQLNQKLIELADGAYIKGLKYSLEAIAKRTIGMDLAKADSPRLEYHKVDGLPLKDWHERFTKYSIDDSIAVVDVFKHQLKTAAAHKHKPVISDAHAQARADWALNLIEAWGMRIDQEQVARLRVEYDAKVETLGPILVDAGLAKDASTKNADLFSGISKPIYKRETRKAQQLFFDACGGDWGKMPLTDKGADLLNDGKEYKDIKFIKVDADACRDLNNPILKSYAELAQAQTFIAGHIAKLEACEDKPMQTRFNSLMETGRTSSGGGFNMQNLSRKEGARECFIPRPGFVFAACDYGSAELHTLGQVVLNIFGESELAKDLNAGHDVHVKVGALLGGLDYDYAIANKKTPEIKKWRQRGKVANFGIPGGLGKETLRVYAKTTYGVDMTTQEVDELFAAYKQAYPDVRRYLNWVGDVTRAGVGDMRQMVSGRMRANIGYTKAANTLFQGLAADGAKAALYQIVKRCYVKTPGSVLYGSRVVNFIHDEILAEIPIDRGHEGAGEISQTMCEYFNKYTPDVPVSAEPCLMDRWSKNAEPVFDESGRLKVWTL